MTAGCPAPSSHGGQKDGRRGPLLPPGGGRAGYLLLFLLAMAGRGGAVEGAAYLKNNEGVRAVGLGGAFTAVPGSAESLWYNPGALNDLRGVEASFTHSRWAEGLDSDHVLVAGTFNWRHQLGLLYHRNAAQDTLRDSQGRELGDFEVSSTVLGGVYAYSGDLFTFGLGAKQLSEVVEKASGSAFAYDLGLQSAVAGDEVLLGLAVLNLGAAPDLRGPGAAAGTEEVQPPLTLRTGAGLRFAGDYNAFLVLADYRYLLASQRSDFSFGVEYSERYEGARLGLRGGWDFSKGALGGLAGLNLGLGLGYGAVSVDYAYTPQEVLGTAHRLSLSLLWDRKAKGGEAELATLYGEAPTPAPTPAATPTPASRPKIKGAKEGVGAALDALMAATPTALPSPTPVVEEKRDKPAGILGTIFSIFSFGKKKAEEEEEPEEKTPPPSVLKGFFRFLGFGSADESEVPDDPDKAKEDAIATTPEPTPAGTPDPKNPQDAAPTPQPTKVIEKVKEILDF